jgi:hypothetical protein
MTQASKRDIAKHKILDTLQKSPEGLRSNELHKRCEKVIVSNSTFWKYIDEMDGRDHTVTRTPDPQDSRAILIKVAPESIKPAFALLEALAEIEKVASGREALRKSELMAFEGLDIDRKDLSKNELKAYIIQRKRIEDLFTITYKLVCEQYQKGEDWKAGEVYLRAFNAKGGTLDEMRALEGITVANLERLRYESAVLANILISTKRHPELEKALEEAIPGVVKIMTKIFAASLGISPQSLTEAGNQRVSLGLRCSSE